MFLKGSLLSQESIALINAVLINCCRSWPPVVLHSTSNAHTNTVKLGRLTLSLSHTLMHAHIQYRILWGLAAVVLLSVFSTKCPETSAAWRKAPRGSWTGERAREEDSQMNSRQETHSKQPDKLSNIVVCSIFMILGAFDRHSCH